MRYNMHFDSAIIDIKHLTETNCTCDSIQLFHVCLVNSQNYATRCFGQLNALLPEAARPRAMCIELSTVPRGIVLTILPNRHEITVLLHNGT